MKRLLALVLVCIILGGTTACADGYFYTERKNMIHENWLWDELSMYSPSDIITAAILGYFWRESQYQSDAVAGCHTTLKGTGRDLCKEILEAVNPGISDGSTKETFIKLARKYGGYGLGQWYRTNYLEGLYDLAVERDLSIGDASLQCEFIFLSLQEDEDLWKKLLKCSDPEKAGRLIAIYYDGTTNGVDYIGYKAKKLYEKYREERSKP